MQHSSLTKGQSDQLETIHSHALHIKLNEHLDYKSACIMFNPETFADNREKLTRQVFSRCIIHSTVCVIYLLPNVIQAHILFDLPNYPTTSHS
jgi:hypothetical protein